jgi:hypothetical protein
MLAPGSDVRTLAVPNPNRCGYPLLQLGSLTLSLRRRHHERSICDLAPMPPPVLTLRSPPVPTLRLPPVPAGRRRSVRRRARRSPPPRRWRPRPLQAPTLDLGTAREECVVVNLQPGSTPMFHQHRGCPASALALLQRCPISAPPVPAAAQPHAGALACRVV